MPVYEVLTTQGTLDAEKRSRLAAEITKVHTEETGAPAGFVQVVFPELPVGHSFTAGVEATPHIIRGQVRAGRAPSVRRAIIERLFEFYADLTDAPRMSILVAVLDVPAQWVMEAGHILPEPTAAEEAAWFARIEADQR